MSADNKRDSHIRMGQKVEVITPLREHHFVKTFYELASDSHFWFQWRFRALMRQMDNLKISTDSNLLALDVGSGNGILRDQIEEATGWTVDITDLHYEALMSSRESRGRTLYYDIVERKPEWAGRYDAVTLFDVLEHIESTREFIDGVLFHLKKGGYLFVNVPAFMGLFSRFDAIQGHFRRYRKSTLISEFESFDLDVVDVRYWGLSNVLPLLLRKLWLNVFRRSLADEDVFREGFAPPARVVNNLFLQIMEAELAIIPRPFIGSSLLLAAVKK